MESQQKEFTVTPITTVNTPPVVKPGPPVPEFIHKLGLDWLLETDREHERMFDRPLAEELDIDISEIWYKVRCVLLPLPQVRPKKIYPLKFLKFH